MDCVGSRRAICCPKQVAPVLMPRSDPRRRSRPERRPENPQPPLERGPSPNSQVLRSYELLGRCCCRAQAIRARVSRSCIWNAVSKPLTRNAGQVDSAPTHQQNVERSAQGMTTRVRSSALTALSSIRLEMANRMPSRIGMEDAAQMMKEKKAIEGEEL